MPGTLETFLIFFFNKANCILYLICIALFTCWRLYERYKTHQCITCKEDVRHSDPQKRWYSGVVCLSCYEKNKDYIDRIGDGEPKSILTRWF